MKYFVFEKVKIYEYLDYTYKKINFNYSRENISIKKNIPIKRRKYFNQKKKIFIL